MRFSVNLLDKQLPFHDSIVDDLMLQLLNVLEGMASKHPNIQSMPLRHSTISKLVEMNLNMAIDLLLSVSLVDNTLRRGE